MGCTDSVSQTSPIWSEGDHADAFQSCGNAILGYSVVFLQSAGFSDVQAFNLNISLSACYIVGGMICWVLMPRMGRATLYMLGLTLMFCCLIAIGGLGFVDSTKSSLAVGILLVISTLINMTTIGPVCYPIVAETPSGKLRYKTISIGRFVYNLTGIFSNSLTPRMIASDGWNWGAKTGLFYAGTNLLCNIWCWYRLPETKDRTFGEIDLMFDDRVPARKFRSTKVDRKSIMHRFSQCMVTLTNFLSVEFAINFEGKGDYGLDKEATVHVESLHHH